MSMSCGHNGKPNDRETQTIHYHLEAAGFVQPFPESTLLPSPSIHKKRDMQKISRMANDQFAKTIDPTKNLQNQLQAQMLDKARSQVIEELERDRVSSQKNLHRKLLLRRQSQKAKVIQKPVQSSQNDTEPN